MSKLERLVKNTFAAAIVALGAEACTLTISSDSATALPQPTPIIEPSMAFIPPAATAEPVQPIVTEAAPANSSLPTNESIPKIKELWNTPVSATSTFNQESAWLIAEPGVINDNTTTYVEMDTDQPYILNVPEGAFRYLSLGYGNIEVDGVNLSLPAEKGTNYLVLLRGRIADAIVDSDLNIDATVTGFKVGHATTAFMPKGAYVSKDWFRDQMVASSTENFTNCGAEGCSKIKIVLFDIDSHSFQKFQVNAGDLDNWKLVAQN